jgi:dihydrofolate synthase/folylpolyglutamate synthase
MTVSSDASCQFKDYADALSRVTALGMDVHKLGTARIINILNKLGQPQNKVPAIHIVGTNGKGSVASYFESIYRSAGFKTGLFTSPHLVDIKERLIINGYPINETTFIEQANQVFEAMGADKGCVRDTKTALSYFECLNAMAFNGFAQAEVDVSIMEAGLGGRLDSTNVLDNPLAVVVTPISLDHTARLGPTITAIAEEKCAVIRPNVPVISGFQHPDAEKVLYNTAKRVGAPLFWVDAAFEAQPLVLGAKTHRPLGPYQSGLLGPYQGQNLALVVATLKATQHALPVSEQALTNGIAQAKWPGRYQWFNNRRLLLDGSHNQAGFETLLSALAIDFLNTPITWGLSLKLNRSLSLLDPIIRHANTAHITLLSAPIEEAHRFHSPDTLNSYINAQRSSLSVSRQDDTTFLASLLNTTAAQLPNQLSSQHQVPITIVTGSLYTAGRLLQHLGKSH